MQPKEELDALLGKFVHATLQFEDGDTAAVVARGWLLSHEDSGQGVIRVADEMGFVNYCWPLLHVVEAQPDQPWPKLPVKQKPSFEELMEDLSGWAEDLAASDCVPWANRVAFAVSELREVFKMDNMSEAEVEKYYAGLDEEFIGGC